MKMKRKNIVPIVLLVLLVGCSKERTLIKHAERYLITIMNDPKSYLREWYQIKDTVTLLEFEKILNERLISDLKKEEPKLRYNAFVFEYNINRYKSYGNSDYFKDALYEETRRYNEVWWKINIIGVEVDSLNKRNNYLSKIKDTTGIKYIDVLIRYQEKNVYGGTVRVLSTIRCIPEEKDQKLSWTFKSVGNEEINSN